MLDLLKLLTPDNDDMSREAIDFVIDEAIKRTVAKFWGTFSDNYKNQKAFVSLQNEPIIVLGENISFYGRDFYSMRPKVESSFSRYELVNFNFIHYTSQNVITEDKNHVTLHNLLYSFDICISYELQQKMLLERQIPKNNSVPAHLIHKI